jgi:hypothetical protein
MLLGHRGRALGSDRKEQESPEKASQSKIGQGDKGRKVRTLLIELRSSQMNLLSEKCSWFPEYFFY